MKSKIHVHFLTLSILSVWSWGQVYNYTCCVLTDTSIVLYGDRQLPGYVIQSIVILLLSVYIYECREHEKDQCLSIICSIYVQGPFCCFIIRIKKKQNPTSTKKTILIAFIDAFLSTCICMGLGCTLWTYYMFIIIMIFNISISTMQRSNWT